MKNKAKFEMNVGEFMFVSIINWGTKIWLCHMFFQYFQLNLVGKIGVYMAIDYIIGVITKLMIFRMNLKDSLNIKKAPGLKK